MVKTTNVGYQDKQWETLEKSKKGKKNANESLPGKCLI